MAKPYVVIGTPSLYADVNFGYVASIQETVKELIQAGISWTGIYAPGDPYLAKVRNNIATRFLLEFPAATHLFMIDADLGWDAKAVVKLIESDHDVCAGVYPKKMDTPEFPCELYLEKEGGSFVERDGFLLANAVPTGFLCIKRHVLVKMAKGRGVYRDLDGKLKYNIFQMGLNTGDVAPIPEGDPLRDEWLKLCALIGSEEPAGWWWGEDYAFCRQWRDLGGQIWVYPDINFTHSGIKHWQNNFKPSVEAFKQGRVTFSDASSVQQVAQPSVVESKLAA